MHLMILHENYMHVSRALRILVSVVVLQNI
jgi:hypothetical protein